MMKILIVIFTSIVLLFSLSPTRVSAQTNQTSQSKRLVLTHVTVIDATGAPPNSDMTVIITGDRITNLGKFGKTRVPKGAQVVDGTGKFLIPGLWDMHVHLSITAESTLPAFIANGVTGVRDMGGDLNQIDGWRKNIAAGLLNGPRIVSPREIRRLSNMPDAGPCSNDYLDWLAKCSEPALASSPELTPRERSLFRL